MEIRRTLNYLAHGPNGNVDYCLKPSMVWNNLKMKSSGRHPQCPKNHAGQKVIFKVSPTNPYPKIILDVDDYR